MSWKGVLGIIGAGFYLHEAQKQARKDGATGYRSRYFRNRAEQRIARERIIHSISPYSAPPEPDPWTAVNCMAADLYDQEFEDERQRRIAEALERIADTPRLLR